MLLDMSNNPPQTFGKISQQVHALSGVCGYYNALKENLMLSLNPEFTNMMMTQEQVQKNQAQYFQEASILSSDRAKFCVKFQEACRMGINPLLSKELLDEQAQLLERIHTLGEIGKSTSEQRYQLSMKKMAMLAQVREEQNALAGQQGAGNESIRLIHEHLQNQSL